MEPLYDVNLQLLADEQLIGPWRVSGKVLSSADAVSALAQTTRLELRAHNRLTLWDDGTGQSRAGAWQIQRDSLLNRPYVELELPDGPTRALITRLRRASSGSPRQLTLYFQTGTELLLDCD